MSKHIKYKSSIGFHFILCSTLLFFPACGPKRDSQSKDTLLVPLKPYRLNSPYASSLYLCTRTEDPAKSLPYLGNEAGPITRDHILNRLMVSDSWMGQRFEEFLDFMAEKTQGDFYQLVKPLKTIAITADISEPGGAHYTFATSRITIEATRLYLSAEEKKSLTGEAKKSILSDYSKKLDFRHFEKKLCKDTKCLVSKTDANGDRSREDVFYLFAETFYHELAHANDYYQPKKYVPELSDELKKLNMDEKNLSSKLQELFPTESVDSAFHNLFGTDRDIIIKSQADLDAINAKWNKDYVSSFLKNNSAVRLYGLNNEKEHLATSFAAFMIYLRFGFSPRTYILNPDDKTIYYGEKERIAMPRVLADIKEAAKLVMPQLSTQIDNVKFDID
ncbi:MAG: hypothetical protein HQK54_15775, partial [Oligoflexales bacterium]|nr:hypothetical protein [Oligoflexales bacterium]